MNNDSLYKNYGLINESIQAGFDPVYYGKTADEYHSMYKSYLPRGKEARILDIGCGKGYFLYYLKQQGYTNFYGIDADLFSIEFTKTHVSECCEHIYAEEFLSDKQDLFDFVIMNEVLEHIPKEKIIPLLKTIRNSLRQGAILICYVPNMENPFSSYTRYHDFTHTIGFTQNSLRMVMNAAGFENIRIHAPKSRRQGIKQFIKRKIQLFVRKILSILFEYPKNGIINSSRIFSVAENKEVL